MVIQDHIMIYNDDRQDDQDHPQGDPGGLERRIESPDHALPPGPQCRPSRVPVALQAGRRDGVIRLFFPSFICRVISSDITDSSSSMEILS